VQVIDFSSSICNASFSNVPPQSYFSDAILRFVLSAALFILAVIQTLKQSVAMYKATKQWQPNMYMQQLVTDGVLYFLVYVSFSPLFHFHSLPSHFPAHLTLVHLQKN
jgi:hypothetical protein